MYEFECARCKKIKEKIIGLSELDQYPIGDPRELGETCECGAKKFRRLVSKFGETKVNWSKWRVGK